MHGSVIDYLKDIQAEINFLLNQTHNKEFETFVNDEVLTRATERSLEILGEAVKIFLLKSVMLIQLLIGKIWQECVIN